MKQSVSRLILLLLCCVLLLSAMPAAVSAEEEIDTPKISSINNTSSTTAQPDTQQTKTNESTFDPLKILPWFFVLPGIAFIAAIFIKIYNIRKKG